MASPDVSAAASDGHRDDDAANTYPAKASISARQALTDPDILPTGTTLRFAVLILMLVATSASLWGYIGLTSIPDGDQIASHRASTPSCPSAP
jgi:hypothetical protein